jgi:hypothetical protein
MVVVKADSKVEVAGIDIHGCEDRETSAAAPSDILGRRKEVDSVSNLDTIGATDVYKKLADPDVFQHPH